jgi:hypothetical protein
MAGHVPAISLRRAFIVAPEPTRYIAGMIATAHRIVIADHARLPWRFFGRLTSVQAGL